MLYQLKMAGATHQRMINFILSPALGKHTVWLFILPILTLLKVVDFKLNVGKWSFDMDSIKLFGFVASDKGVASDPGKVKVISKMPTPYIKDICSFLGASGFSRRNIEGYATIAAPLTSLARKK